MFTPWQWFILVLALAFVAGFASMAVGDGAPAASNRRRVR